MASTSKVGDSRHPLLAGNAKFNEKRANLRLGKCEFESVVTFVVHPPEGEDRWSVVNMRDITDFPPGIAPEERIDNDTRKSPVPLQFNCGRGKYVTHITYIFSRVQKGIPLKDAEEHLHDGPVKYFTDKMEKGFDVVEAYNLTVDEHLEPLPLDCAFGTVSAEGWPVRGFAVRGAAVNGLISCPSDTGMGDGGDMFSSFPGSLPEFNKAFGDILEAPKGVTKWMPPGTSPRKTEVSRDADESEGDPPAPPPGGGSGANKSGSGSGGGSGGGKDDDDDKKKKKKKDKSTPPPEESSDAETEESGSSKSQRSTSKSQHGTPKGKKGKAKSPGWGAELMTLSTPDEERRVRGSKSSKKSSGKRSGKTGKSEKKPSGKRRAWPDSDDDFEESPPKRKKKSDQEAVHPYLENLPDPTQAIRVMCPGVPQLTPPRRSAAYSPEQSAADYQQLLDKAKPGTSGAAPKKKPKKKKAKKDRRGEESKERPPEDAKDAEEGKPKAIRTKNCTPNCQCSTLSMTALRDRCSDEVHHGTLCFMTRTHNTVMMSNKMIRNQLAEQGKEIAALKELVLKTLDFAKSASHYTSSADLTDQDSLALQLPWSSVEQVHRTMASPDLKAALTRVLKCNMISQDYLHFFSGAMHHLFVPELVGRLYVGTKKGSAGKSMETLYWGHEFPLLPSSFFKLLSNYMVQTYNVRLQNVQRKMYNFFQVARRNERKSVRDLVRRRMLQESSHSIWKLIFLNELSRAGVLKTPAPFDAGEAEMTRYVEDHIIAVDAAYEDWKKSLPARGTTEEAEIKDLLARDRAFTDKAGKASPKKAVKRRADSSNESESEVESEGKAESEVEASGSGSGSGSSGSDSDSE